MKFLIKVFLKWLPFAAIATILSLLAYTLVQQDLRQTANDPQIQIAEDLASSIAGGESPKVAVGPNIIDIAKSLAPWAVVYDDTGKVIASAATLDDKTPEIPSGIFDYVRKNGEDKVTFQPRVGVRSAIVMTKFTGKQNGFVVAGRSLREVEIRETQVGYLAITAWLGAMGASLALIIISSFLKKGLKRR